MSTEPYVGLFTFLLADGPFLWNGIMRKRRVCENGPFVFEGRIYANDGHKVARTTPGAFVRMLSPLEMTVVITEVGEASVDFRSHTLPANQSDSACPNHWINPITNRCPDCDRE